MLCQHLSLHPGGLVAVLGNTRGATAGGGDPPPRQRLPLAISYLRILLRAPESLALLSYVLFLQPAWQTDPPPWPSCYSPAPGGKTVKERRSGGPGVPVRQKPSGPQRAQHAALAPRPVIVTRPPPPTGSYGRGPGVLALDKACLLRG